jgi:hypothetical protein
VLIASCKELVARHAGGDAHAAAMPDVIVPASYNFPHSGKLPVGELHPVRGLVLRRGDRSRRLPALALTASSPCSAA